MPAAGCGDVTHFESRRSGAGISPRPRPRRRRRLGEIRPPWAGRYRPLQALLLVGLLALASGAAAQTPQTSSIFEPVSTPASVIRDVSWLLIGVVVFIFLSVEGALFYAVVRSRRRRNAAARTPPQVYGSSPIEVAWTVAPLIIVTVLFLVTARVVYELENVVPPPEDLEVTVVGHQWWWEFHYPELGVVTANELHVPVSSAEQRRPVYLTLKSADVIHSFWVPRLAGKTDVIPNHTNLMWIEPFETGVYVGQCSEYCGTQHANMLLRVVVESPEQFERWVAGQRRPAAAEPSVEAGRALFESLACVSCHRIAGTPARGVFGPDLTHLMSRATLGAGVVANTSENLRVWVEDPGRIKPGVRMPAMDLGAGEAAQLVAFLESLY